MTNRLTELKKRATAGDVASAERLCEDYLLGTNGVKRNSKSAMKWLAVATNAEGDVDAPWSAARIARTAKLADNALKKGRFEFGIRLLETVRERTDDVETTFRLGRIYLEGRFVARDVAKGLDYCRRAAAEEYDDAAAFLGECLVDGEYVEQDVKEGTRYLRDAARRDHPGALIKLGDLFVEGELVPFKPKRGVALYRRAAECESAVALLKLGALYIAGDVVPRDLKKGYKYFSRAAKLE